MDDNEEGDRIAELMGDKTIMVMGAHGVTVVGADRARGVRRMLHRRAHLHVSDDRDGDGPEAAVTCPTVRAGGGPDLGARRSMRGCTWMRGGASWTARNPTTRADGTAQDANVGRKSQRPRALDPGGSASRHFFADKKVAEMRCAVPPYDRTVAGGIRQVHASNELPRAVTRVRVV